MNLSLFFLENHIAGAWTQKKLYDINWADSKYCKCCQAETVENCTIAVNGGKKGLRCQMS